MTLLVLVALTASPLEQCSASALSGQQLRDENKWLAASKQFLSCAQEMCPKVVRNDCVRWRTELEDAMPTLLVAVQADGADVTDATVELDGVPLDLDGTAVPVDPGKHLLSAKRGKRSAAVNVLALEKVKGRVLVLALEPEPVPVVEPKPEPPPPPPPPPPSRSFSWLGPVGVGVLGAVGVVSGLVLGFDGRAHVERLKLYPCAETFTCGDDHFAPARGQLVAADVLLAVGLVLVVGALAWALFSFVGN